MQQGLTFKCTRCRAKPAVVKKGRKTFLCASCASDLMWQDIVGWISDPVGEDDAPDAGSV
jgi:hypothetical protein